MLKVMSCSVRCVVGLLANNSLFHSHTKHIEINVHYVRKQITTKSISVQYVPYEFETIDIVMKPLSIVRFSFLRKA